MRFRPDNKIVADFDHINYYIGIPSCVDFTVKDCGKTYRLTAPGYGVLYKNPSQYGNGSLAVWKHRLTTKQRQHFEREVNSE